MVDPFALDQYVARRQMFRLSFSPGFDIYDTLGNKVAFVEQKGFRLKEDIQVFTDASKNTRLLGIAAQQVLDISASYDVADAKGQPVGKLRRKGLKSIVRDEWLVFDSSGEEIGLLQEDSAFLAVLRRFVPGGALIPQSFTVSLRGRPVGAIKQHFNPFVLKYAVDLTADPGRGLDRRLALAAVVLLLAIEGRQD